MGLARSWPHGRGKGPFLSTMWGEAPSLVLGLDLGWSIGSKVSRRRNQTGLVPRVKGVRPACKR